MDTIILNEGCLEQKMLALPNSVINDLKQNEITKNFYVSNLGYYPIAKHHYRFRKKGAVKYIFIYCTKGKGKIIINDNVHLIEPNQFFIIPKDIKHEYKADKLDPWSVYWLHFNGPIAQELYNRYALTTYDTSKNAPFSADRILLFKKIFNYFNGDNQENLLEYANLLSLSFISSFIYNDFATKTNLKKDEETVDLIKKFLLNNLDKNFSLDEIATKFNYSKSYLHAKFKNKTGYPLLVFFNLKKIQKACEYFNYTKLSIKEICLKTGFKDPLYFSRIFKNFMGESPRNYKKNQLK